jgi:hypothetical protein
MILRLKLLGVVRIAAPMAALACSLTLTGAAQEKAMHLGEAKTATVRIIALCGIPEKIDFRCNLKMWNFRNDSEGVNLAGRFRFGSGSEIPYGRYEAVAYFEDAWPAIPILLGTVEVSQPDVLAVVDLRPQPSGSSRMKLQFPTTGNR